MMTIVMNTKARRMTEMANALKCDRCGKLYENYKGIRIGDRGAYYCCMSIITSDGWVRRGYDLCPECMTKLVEFLKLDEEVSNG